MVAGQKTDYHPDGINKLQQKHEKIKSFLEKIKKNPLHVNFFILANILANKFVSQLN